MSCVRADLSGVHVKLSCFKQDVYSSLRYPLRDPETFLVALVYSDRSDLDVSPAGSIFSLSQRDLPY